MRTFTKPVEQPARLRAVTEHAYVSAFGAGRLVLAGDLPLRLDLPDPRFDALKADAPSPGAEAARWLALLERYFAGAPVDFDLDVTAHGDAFGFTDFEYAVFTALAAVPYGTAVSYRELAAAAGRPSAYRAVGSAMARNRLPVILPCHRVIKNDGRLGQYGDDPAWKERLLALEGVRVHDGRAT